MCPSQTHIETFSSTNKMLGLKVSFNKCKILESYQESSLTTMVYNQKSTTRERNDFKKKTTPPLYHTTEQKQQQKVNYCKNKIV